jgi:hypothetical protein
MGALPAVSVRRRRETPRRANSKRLRRGRQGSAYRGASRARPSTAQELAAQVIGVSSVALPGLPSGVARDVIGQFPSGVCVATRKSIAH